jgi:hypothetical protein
MRVVQLGPQARLFAQGGWLGLFDSLAVKRSDVVKLADDGGDEVMEEARRKRRFILT